MQVTSHIAGVPPFHVPPSDLEWVRNALTAAAARLGWASLDLALQVLDTGRAGSEDGYNLHAEARAEFVPYAHTDVPPDSTHGRISWAIRGGCSYGSVIEVRPTAFRIQSAGGHWVSARWATYGCIDWDADPLPSDISWGESTPDVPARIASLQEYARPAAYASQT